MIGQGVCRGAHSVNSGRPNPRTTDGTTSFSDGCDGVSVPVRHTGVGKKATAMSKKLAVDGW